MLIRRKSPEKEEKVKERDRRREKFLLTAAALAVLSLSYSFALAWTLRGAEADVFGWMRNQPTFTIFMVALFPVAMAIVLANLDIESLRLARFET